MDSSQISQSGLDAEAVRDHVVIQDVEQHGRAVEERRFAILSYRAHNDAAQLPATGPSLAAHVAYYLHQRIPHPENNAQIDHFEQASAGCQSLIQPS